MDWNWTDEGAERLSRLVSREFADGQIKKEAYSIGLCAALLFDFATTETDKAEAKRHRGNAERELRKFEELRNRDRAVLRPTPLTLAKVKAQLGVI